MTTTRQTAVAAGAFALGSALISRALRGSRRIEFANRSVLITGGSRGLGLLLAREFGRLGARVTIAARDQAELNRAIEDLQDRGIDAASVVCDVTDRNAAEALVRGVIERTGSLDVLVNNAGVMSVGPLEHMTHDDFNEAMAVHFQGPLNTMLEAIPAMRGQGGRIVNISSIGGKIAVPHMAPYCASKFALVGLSDSLQGELAKDRIYVTTVCPGLMRTGSPFNAWFKGRHRDEFTWFTIAGSMPGLSIDGRTAADRIVRAAQYGDTELVLTWSAKLAILARALAPRAVASATALANRCLPAPSEGRDATWSGWQSLSAWAPSKLTVLTERAAEANNELPGG